uniref:EAL domain-containing protein n=2 Tax=Rhizobium laguerreae TaxID=1076926 RepID=A0A6N9Z9F8_9HYPH|nr:EAL domain-containing protein [Rhizobium laguerreae]
MAKALGKRVVAEGVETVPEFHALQALGCHYGQGYLFGRPLASLICNFLPIRANRNNGADQRVPLPARSRLHADQRNFIRPEDMGNKTYPRYG